MTGPATNAATITTVWKVLGRRTALIYLLTVAGSALAAGLMLDYILRIPGVAAAPGMPWMLPGWVKSLCAVVLLGVLGWAALRPLFGRGRAVGREAAMRSERLLVDGMTCTHCAAAVRRALLECPGVDSAEVDLDSGAAAVAGEGLDFDELRAAVEAMGYGLRPSPAEPGE